MELDENEFRNRERLDMAAIKGQHQNVRDAIRRGEPTVDLGPWGWTFQQLGLQPIMADEWGRIWRVDLERNALTLVFQPYRRPAIR